MYVYKYMIHNPLSHEFRQRVMSEDEFIEVEPYARSHPSNHVWTSVDGAVMCRITSLQHVDGIRDKLRKLLKQERVLDVPKFEASKTLYIYRYEMQDSGEYTYSEKTMCVPDLAKADGGWCSTSCGEVYPTHYACAYPVTYVQRIRSEPVPDIESILERKCKLLWNSRFS